jgi:origin recognition complex subunit 2
VDAMDVVDADADALEALTLRFRFKEYPFIGLLWNCLREAGWTYHNGPYQDPGSTRTFEHSKDIAIYLDQFAVPDVRSNLESFRSSTLIEQEEEQRGRQLRRDVLRIWYLRTASKSVEKMATNENTTTTTTVTKTTSHKEISRRSARASVTSIEKGSDLYLHKNTVKARGKAKKAQHPLDMEAPAALPSIQECIEGIKGYSLDEVVSIENAYKSSFEEWRFLLSTNHSIMFFGAGSKRKLLNQFCEQELDKEGYALAIDGCDSHVTVEAILNLLVTLFLDGKEPIPMASIAMEDGDHQRVGISNPWKAHELVERAIVVSRALAHEASISLVPIFLVIHNLDGESFRNTLAQESLAALLVNSTVANGVASIRLVASVDHVDASALLWNVSTSANFAWIWKEVHTHRPYVEELAMLSDDVRKKTAKLKNQELDHADRALEVLKNLAPRHAEVVQILARLQLGQSQTDGWIDYLVFRNECKSICAISKDSQLRSFLVELNDHRLIISKIEDRAELVRVPYSEAKLHEILAYNRNDASN